jgi:hypothetical protein
LTSAKQAQESVMVLGDASVPHLVEAEHTLQDAERMLLCCVKSYVVQRGIRSYQRVFQIIFAQHNFMLFPATKVVGAMNP